MASQSQAEKERDKALSDLAFANMQIEELEEKLHRASSKLAAKDPKPIPAGADGAVLLVESCTFMASDSKTIVSAMAGDLVMVTSMDEARKTQINLGPGHRVYAVTKSTLESLSNYGFVSQ